MKKQYAAIGRVLGTIVGAHEPISRDRISSLSRLGESRLDSALNWLQKNKFVISAGKNVYIATEGALQRFSKLSQPSGGRKGKSNKKRLKLESFLDGKIPYKKQMGKTIQRLRSGTKLTEKETRLFGNFVREGIVGYHMPRLGTHDPTELISTFLGLARRLVKYKEDQSSLIKLEKELLHDLVPSEPLMPTHMKQKDDVHLQEKLFTQIRLKPDSFYDEASFEHKERARNILAMMDTFDERTKQFAQFNFRFFSELAEKSPKFEPISLPHDEGYFRWPDTSVVLKSRRLDSLDLDAEDAGVLSLLGYNVRRGGPESFERRRVLGNLFLGNVSLPRRLPDKHLVQWGEASSVARLKKMAFSIAQFVRLQKQKDSPSEQAIEKWESDLNFLKEKYYAPFTSMFNWPST